MMCDVCLLFVATFDIVFISAHVVDLMQFDTERPIIRIS